MMRNTMRILSVLALGGYQFSATSSPIPLWTATMAVFYLLSLIKLCRPDSGEYDPSWRVAFAGAVGLAGVAYFDTMCLGLVDTPGYAAWSAFQQVAAAFWPVVAVRLLLATPSKRQKLRALAV